MATHSVGANVAWRFFARMGVVVIAVFAIALVIAMAPMG
jgi:hypothetical protein